MELFGGSNSVLDVLANISFIVWMPAAWFEYRREKRREREQREQEIVAHTREVYESVDAMYVEFQKLCLQYPYLDVWDLPDEQAEELTPRQRKEERIAFTVLFSLFERAFLLHRRYHTEAMQQRWLGWDAHLREYFKRPNFRDSWHQGVASYDPRFEAYMNEVERETARG